MKPIPPRVTAQLNIAGPIIDKFGGDQPCAEKTGYPVTRIRNWRKAGDIPEKYRPWMLYSARIHDVPHTPWDYIAHLVEYPIAA